MDNTIIFLALLAIVMNGCFWVISEYRIIKKIDEKIDDLFESLTENLK